MREEPSKSLIERLERLGLADAATVRAQRRNVRHLARELPLFESVWIDALARARVLTPYQASELNAGRGEWLRVGPLVICRRVASPGYADYYSAREVDGGRPVRLAVAEPIPGQPDELEERLSRLIAKSKALDSGKFVPIDRGQVEPERVWLAGPAADGEPAADWMVSNGRFPPAAALEIARQMAAMLAELERSGLPHGDIAAWNLHVTEAGEVVLPQPGVRTLLRPEEGFARTDLLPEAYDYLAPERITQGTPPTVDSDVYACGALWWHMLTGRPPRQGGTALAKLQAAQSAEILDVRHLAPDTPKPLAKVIAACTRREPNRRPESMARVAAILGPPTRNGRLHLAACISNPGRQPSPWTVSVSAARHSRQTPIWMSAVAGCLVIVAGLAWAFRGADKPPVAKMATEPPPGATAAAPATPAGPQEESSRAATSAFTMPLMQDESVAQTSLLRVQPTESERHDAPVQPNRTTYGRPDQRSTVLVPPEGLFVDTEGAQFINIDFVRRPGTRASGSESAPLIELRTSEAEFHGCSFQMAGVGAAPSAAVRWVHPVDRDRAQLMLLSGRVAMSDCVIRGVEAGIECRTLGAIAIDMTNVLCLGARALVALDHCPAADEPIAITLAGVTTRGPGAVLECQCQEAVFQPAKIRIEAGQSVFVGAASAGLMTFVGPASPKELLASLEWAGDGSLVAPDLPFACWRRTDGSTEPLDDTAVAVAGLVRSEVQFAGSPEVGPAASRATRWNAPLRSADPPGIDPSRLHWAQ